MFEKFTLFEKKICTLSLFTHMYKYRIDRGEPPGPCLSVCWRIKQSIVITWMDRSSVDDTRGRRSDIDSLADARIEETSRRRRNR